MTVIEYKKTRLETTGPVAHIILDDQDKKVNMLGREMLAELNSRFDSLEKDEAVKAIVIRSAKHSVFIAGADINEIQAIALSPDAREGGQTASLAGQELMNRLEDFPKPVVAAIHGPCLGGGLELALSCSGRVASNDPITKLGLPELKLGITPGFGGTWRLPRLIGFTRGLTTILTSKNFDGKSALKQGLVDDLCFKEQMPQVAQELALKLLDQKQKSLIKAKRKKAVPIIERLIGLPGLRHIAAQVAYSGVMKKTHGTYPALPGLISLVTSGFGKSRKSAMAAERMSLGNTMATKVCANLLRMFFLSRDAKKQTGGIKGRQIELAGIVGSGLMGSGIGVAMTSRAGIRTMLKDTDIAVLGRALKKTWDQGKKRVKRHQMSELDAVRQFNLISTGTGYGSFQRADIVIEAVPEIMDFKRKIFGEVEAVVRPETVIASNTSSLPISKLAEGAEHPERFIGMHFFMPAEVMPLVEVIPGEKTSPQTIATVVDLALAMGKVPVVVKDVAGFLVNRVLAAYMLEAAQMVEEGTPVSKVDCIAEEYGMPMGPIRLMAEVGVEVMRKVLHQLQGAYGKNMAAPGWVSREDLAGAFARAKDNKWIVNGKIISGWVNKSDPKIPVADIRDRLSTALLIESVRCLEEGVVAGPGMLDLSMVYGIGFPAFRGGPLAEADSRGIAETERLANDLAAKYGDRFVPPALLKQMADDKSLFYK